MTTREQQIAELQRIARATAERPPRRTGTSAERADGIDRTDSEPGFRTGDFVGANN